MPQQVRIMQRPNSPEWDKLIRAAMEPGRLGVEHYYFGITDAERADTVRRSLRTAGRHQGVGSRVYYSECPEPGSCRFAGPSCRFHVNYTVYPLDEARAYKASRAGGDGESRQRRPASR